MLQGKPGRTNAAVHSINTEAKPFRLQPYRIPHAYKEEVAKELKEMERNNIIEPSSSEWASPNVIVRKKDGSIRLCVDFRQLNSVTAMDAYPMPRVEDQSKVHYNFRPCKGILSSTDGYKGSKLNSIRHSRWIIPFQSYAIWT